MFEFKVEHPKHNKNHWDTDNMPEEEPANRIFHPTIGEELDPASVQYQAIHRFIINKDNTPSANAIL